MIAQQPLRRDVGERIASVDVAPPIGTAPAVDAEASHMSNLFAMATRCYAAGIRKQAAPPDVPGFNDSDALVDTLLEGDAARIREISRFRGGVLTAAREGDFDRANGLLKLMVHQLSLDDMAEESWFVAIQIVKPLESYICYKQNNGQQARTLMKKAIWASNVLRDRFGHDMDARRVHLAGNLMRLESHSGHVRQAAKMGFKLLHYIEGAGKLWPLPSLKAETLDVDIAASMRFAMFGQITTKLVFALAHADEATHDRVLADGESIAEQRRAEQTPRIEHLRIWTQAKRALAQGDIADFLVRASTFFASCRENHALRVALSADVCHLCKQDGCANASALERIITEHLGDLKKFNDIMNAPRYS